MQKTHSSEKPRMFLATTALDELWDKSQPILFLGEWCKKNEKRCVWEKLDFDTFSVSYTQEETDQIYVYTKQVYEDLLISLSGWLNSIHGVSYSLKYWRILIGPFLLNYIVNVYNKFDYLNKAYKLYPDLSTIGLMEKSYITPIDTHEFLQIYGESDSWNLQLFTQLIVLYYKKPITFKCFFSESELPDRSNKLNSRPFKRNFFGKIKQKFFFLFVRYFGKNIILHLHHLPNLNRKKSYLMFFLSYFKVLPISRLPISRSKKITDIQLQLLLRDEITKLPVKDQFTKIILDTLKINMPFNFIELYHEQSEFSNKSYPYMSAGITTGVEIIGDDIYKFWAAQQVESGVKIIGLQHGGSYWIRPNDCYQILEFEADDYFITWGWSNSENIISNSSIPVSDALRVYKKYNINNRSGNVLWTGTYLRNYFFSMGGYALSRQHYEHHQKRFYSKLNQEVIDKMTLRLHSENSQDFYKYCIENFSSCEVVWQNPNKSFLDQLFAARIYVGDSLNTTHHFALALNIPTILFLDVKAWGARKESMPYFLALADVGILHDTPEAAANMLNKIFDDPWEWWSKDNVQAARKKFSDEFSKVSDNWLQDYVKSLLLIHRKIRESKYDAIVENNSHAMNM